MPWRIQLAEYDYEIVHKRGTQNTNADALSRIGSVTKVTGHLGIPDESEKKKIFYEFHGSPVGGHRGMTETYRAGRAQYRWPNMKQ